MRALLLHLDGVEMWEVIAVSDGTQGVKYALTSYEIIEVMDIHLAPAQQFSSHADALTELHALVARNAAHRLQRIAARRPRPLRRWSALMTSWLASDSAVGASHARSRASAIRAVRAHRVDPAPVEAA